MKRTIAMLLLITALFSKTAFAFGEQGIFEMHEIGDTRIVSTVRQLVPAPRQSVYMYYNYGVTDKDGNFIVEPVYDEINTFKEGRALFRKDGKYGFFDEAWNVVIEPVYTSAGEFSEGLACVAYENYIRGYIDNDGNTVIPFIYELAYSFEGETARVGAAIEGYNGNRFFKEGKIDKSGNIVEPLCFKHEASYDVVMSENNININGNVYNNKELQYPFINYLGLTYIPLTYHGCREMGFACEWDAETGLVLKNEKEIPGSIVGTNTMKKGEYFKASLYTGALTVGSEAYTAADVYYPLLTWNDVVYMPVLWRQGMEALKLDYSYDLESYSLIIMNVS